MVCATPSRRCGSVCTNDPTDEQLRLARRLGSAAAEHADLSTSAGVATVNAYRAVQAHLAIHHITTNARGISDADIAASEPDRREEDEDAAPGLNPSTKAAIQVAVATSAATVLGELISPDRWYWAVLTAFLVFTGVTTRGEILSRAGHRIVGTVVGVVAGVLLAAVIGHNSPVQIVVLLVCVFFAFYLVTVAYFWLTFFVTVLLAMLYGLLGNFSLQVLELRIAETAAGALVGIASAYFIFSTKTRDTFAEKVDDYLDQMQQVIDTAVTRGTDTRGRRRSGCRYPSTGQRLEGCHHCRQTPSDGPIFGSATGGPATDARIADRQPVRPCVGPRRGHRGTCRRTSRRRRRGAAPSCREGRRRGGQCAETGCRRRPQFI